jgi:nitrogen PTS system EIIA component
MSFGTTLRVLRLQSGLGLRDLARRLGVSSTYLSRIENDIDPVPTPARLAHIARELGVSATTLIELGRRVSPLLSEYVEQVPEAGSLFADLALRKLAACELAEIQTFVDQRFSPRGRLTSALAPSLVTLLAEERLVLGLRCANVMDALQIAAGRLANHSDTDPASVTAALVARASEIAMGVGGGVAVLCGTLPEAAHLAALVTLSDPIQYATPDKLPLRVLIVFVGPKGNVPFCQHIAEVARLADRGLAAALCNCTTAPELLHVLASLSGVVS